MFLLYLIILFFLFSNVKMKNGALFVMKMIVTRKRSIHQLWQWAICCSLYFLSFSVFSKFSSFQFINFYIYWHKFIKNYWIQYNNSKLKLVSQCIPLENKNPIRSFQWNSFVFFSTFSFKWTHLSVHSSKICFVSEGAVWSFFILQLCYVRCELMPDENIESQKRMSWWIRNAEVENYHLICLLSSILHQFFHWFSLNSL